MPSLSDTLLPTGDCAEIAGLPRERVLAWGYAGAVIAAAWALQDGADPAAFLAAAESLAG